MRLVDTHCHIHEDSYGLDPDAVLTRAREAGVDRVICVGTDADSSRKALAFAGPRDGVFASIGIHPHEASHAAAGQIEALGRDPDGKNAQKLVAIGEIGLDYFYTHSPREQQMPLLEAQLQLARDRDLPVIFHVRDAFADFWPVFANFPGLRGVLHSFTDTAATLERALAEGLFIGVNGISLFTRDPAQQAMFAMVPLDKLLFETDAPYLTPPPFRGTINQSAYVRLIASYHAELRQVTEDTIATINTASAEALFKL